MRASRFIAGDPLRGLAALAVVGYHAGAVALGSTGHGGPTADWPTAFGFLGEPLSSGANGVRVFFVLSGYLIARPFLHGYVDGVSSPSVPGYVLKRATRLLPALWVTILAVVLLTGAGGGGALTVLRAMFFVEDWSHSPLGGHLGQLWTLNAEARFYLLVPVVAGLFIGLARLTGRPRTPSGRLALVGIAALVVSGVVLVLTNRPHAFVSVGAVRQVHLFLFGLLLAVAERAGAWSWVATRAGRIGAAVLTVAGAAALLWPGPLVWDRAVELGGPLQLEGELGQSLAALLVVGGPLLLQRAGGGCWRALDNPPLRWLGQRSYSLYLIHLALFTELAAIAPGTRQYRLAFAFLVVVGVPLAFLLAEISWRLVERPALRLRPRLGVRGGAGGAPRAALVSPRRS